MADSRKIAPNESVAQRRERLAAELRSNLAKRKAQARARGARSGEGEAASGQSADAE